MTSDNKFEMQCIDRLIGLGFYVNNTDDYQYESLGETPHKTINVSFKKYWAEVSISFTGYAQKFNRKFHYHEYYHEMMTPDRFIFHITRYVNGLFSNTETQLIIRDVFGLIPKGISYVLYEQESAYQNIVLRCEVGNGEINLYIPDPVNTTTADIKHKIKIPLYFPKDSFEPDSSISGPNVLFLIIKVYQSSSNLKYLYDTILNRFKTLFNKVVIKPLVQLGYTMGLESAVPTYSKTYQYKGKEEVVKILVLHIHDNNPSEVLTYHVHKSGDYNLFGIKNGKSFSYLEADKLVEWVKAVDGFYSEDGGDDTSKSKPVSDEAINKEVKKKLDQIEQLKEYEDFGFTPIEVEYGCGLQTLTTDANFYSLIHDVQKKLSTLIKAPKKETISPSTREWNIYKISFGMNVIAAVLSNDTTYKHPKNKTKTQTQTQIKPSNINKTTDLPPKYSSISCSLDYVDLVKYIPVGNNFTELVKKLFGHVGAPKYEVKVTHNQFHASYVYQTMDINNLKKDWIALKKELNRFGIIFKVYPMDGEICPGGRDKVFEELKIGPSSEIWLLQYDKDGFKDEE